MKGTKFNKRIVFVLALLILFTSTVSNILKALKEEGNFEEGGYEKIRTL